MPVVSEMVHPAGLSFPMQRKAFVLRHVRKKPWEEIAKERRNPQGEQTPSGGLETTLKRAAIGKVRSAKIPAALTDSSAPP